METQTTVPETPTESQLARDERWRKRLARRARRIERNRATCAEGMTARAERLATNPGDVAQRFSETQ